MSKRFSIYHNGPIAYVDTLAEAKAIQQLILSQGFFMYDGKKHKVTNKIGIYDGEKDLDF